MLGEHPTEQATISELLHALTNDTPTESIIGLLEKLVPEAATASRVSELVAGLLGSLNPAYAGIDELGVSAIDCCGTGGSGISHFNTSTSVAFVLAANDVPVVKFGNRAASSKSGSFDFLDALQIPMLSNSEQAATVMSKCNLVFLSAASAYPVLLKLAPARRALGQPTILNFVGPLLNPARPAYRLLGISNAHMHTIAAEYLETDLRTSRALLVRSTCGLDEFCVSCSADVIEVGRGVRRAPATSREHACAVKSSAPGSTPESNAARLLEIFSGNDTSSTAYELIIKNAAAALCLVGVADDMDAASTLAKKTIASGQAMRTLENCRGRL